MSGMDSECIFSSDKTVRKTEDCLGYDINLHLVVRLQF